VSRELRVGGVWEIDFGIRLDGSSFTFGTEFLFEPRDGATLMTMIQSGFPSEELREEHGRGVAHGFDRLERALAA
jgi:hypothetical protein